MSDAPRPDDAADTPTLPSDAQEREDVIGVARRAPRFGRIIGTGAFGAGLIGFVLGMILPNSTGVGRAMVGLVVGVGFAVFGGLVAGLVAVRLDGRDPGPVQAPDWLPDADEAEQVEAEQVEAAEEAPFDTVIDDEPAAANEPEERA